MPSWTALRWVVVVSFVAVWPFAAFFMLRTVRPGLSETLLHHPHHGRAEELLQRRRHIHTLARKRLHDQQQRGYLADPARPDGGGGGEAGGAEGSSLTPAELLRRQQQFGGLGYNEARRLFTDEVAPASDSSCVIPPVGGIHDVPKVNWVPCDTVDRTFAHVLSGGARIFVDCPRFRVSTTDRREYLLDGSGARVFTDGAGGADTRGRKPAEAGMRLMRPSHQWGEEQRGPTSIAFTVPSIAIKCLAGGFLDDEKGGGIEQKGEATNYRTKYDLRSGATLCGIQCSDICTLRNDMLHVET